MIPAQVMALRIEGADATLRGILELHAQHLASRAPARDRVDHARHELALGLLANEEVGVDEVATALGCSEPSAFVQAFQRWIGCSPGTWRRARPNLAARRTGGVP